MKKINETQILKETILLMKMKQSEEFLQLKDQYLYTFESLKPLNLIKNAFGQMATSSEFKQIKYFKQSSALPKSNSV